jgi:lipoprotein-anchoring transpeptidase ErfK/SrfK
MLRAIALAVTFFAVIPSMSAFADPDKANPNIATTTETPSGATTFFGKGGETAPAVANQEPTVVKPQPLPPPTLTASVDLARQKMTVSINGEPRYTWPISSGTARFPTPTGNFRPEWTSKMWYSRKYDNAPMPNAVFINGGVAVHGTYHMASLGSPASHGCIRLSPGNAKTFYSLVQRHGLRFTRVSVHGRPNWRDGGAIASRRDSRRNDDVASDNQNWFWGGSASSDDYYDAPPARKRDRKGYSYVYIDGVPTKVKVYRRKNGDYAYKAAPRERKYRNTYGDASQAN